MLLTVYAGAEAYSRTLTSVHQEESTDLGVTQRHALSNKSRRLKCKEKAAAPILGVSQRPALFAPERSLYVPLSPTLPRRAHNIAWALRTYTMPHLPGPSLLSREAPARVRRPARKTRPRSVSGASAARILNGSLHTSGRGCASREGHTNTLPALPLRAAQRDKRGWRTHAAAPQQHGAPIPSRTARTNWRSSPKVIPKRRLLVRQSSTFLVPGSGTTCDTKSTSNFQGANPGIRNCSDSTNSAHAAKRPKPHYLPLQRRKTEGFAIPP